MTESEAGQAIRRLGDEALVRQGLDLEHPGSPRVLSATSLGGLVALQMQEMGKGENA